MKDIKAIIIPGNGGNSPGDKWFPYIKNELERIGIETINVKYPDPDLARGKFWLPFIKELGADENTILIGHSSGAVAAMRYAESNRVLGSVLVAGSFTDLGEEKERASGYFDAPWNWEAIKKNQNWIIQYASTDDPFIPIQEARTINKNLGSKYFEYDNQGHFGTADNKKEFPEILEQIKICIKDL